MTRKDKIKAHFEDHKQFYIGLGIGLGLAGITWVIVKERCADMRGVSDGSSTAESLVATRSFNFFAKNSGNVVNTIHNGTRGHPGFMIRNLETGLDFASQAEAARYFGLTPSILSAHLNKGFILKEGLTFERSAPHSQELHGL